MNLKDYVLKSGKYPEISTKVLSGKEIREMSNTGIRKEIGRTNKILDEAGKTFHREELKKRKV